MHMVKRLNSLLALSLCLTVLCGWQQQAAIAVNPGFRIVITDKGLDYVLKVGIPILQDALATTKIPDQSGSASSPVGHIDYSLTNIKLSPIKIPTSSLTPGTSGLQLKASGISISANADWHYKMKDFPYVSDHGSARVSASGVSLAVTVTLGADSAGHPTLKSGGCSFHIDHLDVHFDGGASWLYNLFADNIADSLKGTLQSQLCQAAVQEINTDGNKALETLPIEVKIDDYAQVNYALVGAPIMTSAYVETNHKGEFMSAVKPVEAPMSAEPIPAPTGTDKMMYVWLTDYVANTAGYVYTIAGQLAYNVTPDMLPPSSPIQLNTSSFKIILPQLYKTYPNMAMDLYLSASSPPNMTISSKSINLTAPAYVNVSVVDTASKLTKPAFTLGVVVYCDMTVTVKANGSQEVVSGNANFLRAAISLVSSEIGSFQVSVLQDFANLLSKTFVLPFINGYANKGIAIPMFDGISFLNANITLADHCVMVSSDINYKPTF